MWLLLVDGRQLAVPKIFFPRLRKASNEQLLRFELMGGGVGIHWDELDEDIRVPSLLLGIGDRTTANDFA
jgi:hypothetical protein